MSLEIFPTFPKIRAEQIGEISWLDVWGSQLRIYNVADFGAIGDGVTDDTNAIQAALNYISNNGGGILRFIPGRTYLVSRQTNGTAITLRSGIYIDGNGATIKLAPHNSLLARLLEGVNIQNLIISGITLDYDKTTKPVGEQQYCMLLNGCTNILLYNITAQNSRGDGLLFLNSQRVIISDSKFLNNDRNGITVYDNIQNATISQCTFDGNSAQAIDFEPDGGASITDVVIEGCYINHPNGLALSISGHEVGGIYPAKRVRCINNTIIGGVFLIHTEQCIVSNNIIVGANNTNYYTSTGVIYAQRRNVDLVISDNIILSNANSQRGIIMRPQTEVNSQYVINRAAIRGNIISVTDIGIMPLGSKIEITENIIDTPQIAIWLFATEGSTVSDCIIAHNQLNTNNQGISINDTVLPVSNIAISENLYRGGSYVVAYGGTSVLYLNQNGLIYLPNAYARTPWGFMYSGSPEGIITASPGALCTSTNGVLYVKRTGVGNTGWKAVTMDP